MYSIIMNFKIITFTNDNSGFALFLSLMEMSRCYLEDSEQSGNVDVDPGDASL